MELSVDDLREIEAKLPNLSKLQNCIHLDPSIIAKCTGPGGRFDTAVVCLQDAFFVCHEVVHALSHAAQHIILINRSRRDGTDDRKAIFLAKFYSDDAALRLYAAAEHSANFIADFLQISEADLKPYKDKNRLTSRASIVGTYIHGELRNHALATAINQLRSASQWDKTMKYRNTWVHNQPPLLKGSGIVFERKERWIVKDGYADLFIGGEDEPKITIESLFEMVSTASKAFGVFLTELFELALARAKDLGVSLQVDGDKVTITF